MKQLLTALVMALLLCVPIVQAESDSDNRAILIFKNCDTDAWMGGVEWETCELKAYKERPDFRLKTRGMKEVRVKPGCYSITIYRPSDNKILDFATFEAPPKQRITLEWPNGCGRSQ